MLKDPVARLRFVGKLEAVSYLLLLGVAMPLKHLAGQPMAVRIVGLAHGMLFIVLGILTLQMMTEHDWPLKKAAMVMVAALLPFGPFAIDRRLAEEAEQAVAAKTAGD